MPSGAAVPPGPPRRIDDEATQGVDVADPTGTVRVAMDGQGRVTDVQIAQRWRSHLSPDALPTTLVHTPSRTGTPCPSGR